MNAAESLYNSMLADGDDPEAPRRVRVEHRGDRAVVTLDEPDRLNVLSAPLVRQLRRALDSLIADTDIRSVVLTGTDPGFSAGGDLKMMRVATERLSQPEGVADVWRWIRREFGVSPGRTPYSWARSMAPRQESASRALTCDLTIASERAVIVPAFGRLGLIPEASTSWALTRRLGYQGALAYYLRGEQSTPTPPNSWASCSRSSLTKGFSLPPMSDAR